MKTINFVFGIHNHQPVGNFDYVIEEAYQKSYLPFIEAIEEFPNIHISFHYSGCLLEWLEKHHVDYIDRIKKLVERGNVEIISGGFYEPILTVLPESDKIAQIQMLNSYIKEKFNYTPHGLWLTERVWEPHLAKAISEAGIDYVTVDDYHFLSTGIQESDLTGYFITEEQGKAVSIFPINQNLRYLIPFDDPQKTIDYLLAFATEDSNNIIVMADDGEKFGVWPGTYETVFEKNWLRDFFTLLESNKERIKTKTFKECFESHLPKGRIYLPSASYFEMSEWSLPAEAGEKFGDLIQKFKNQGTLDYIKPFIKGGVWRNFLFKYDESNWMHKKYIYLSNRYNKLQKEINSKEGKGKLERARQNLWRGSCNCAYWHGIFGGLYLPHLRHAIYKELLKSEKLLNELDNRGNFQVEILDIDIDGGKEIIVENQNLYLAFAPHKGAILQELSLLDKSFNLLNTLKRYKESYHRKVKYAEETQNTQGSIHDIIAVKEKGLDKYLKYDIYPRKTFVDHVINPSITLQQFRDGEYYEDSDFINGHYDFDINKRVRKITFIRDGWVNWKRFSIKKEVKVGKSSIVVIYHLYNIDKERNAFRFGPEFNFAMLSGDSPDRYYSSENRKLADVNLNSVSVEKELDNLSIISEFDGFKVTIKTNTPIEFWRFPVETVSLSESGFERGYQSSVVIPWFDIDLKSGEEEEVKLTLSILNT